MDCPFCSALSRKPATIPSSWISLSNRPDFAVAPWAGQFPWCPECGRIWYCRENKNGPVAAVPLPDAMIPLLTRGAGGRDLALCFFPHRRVKHPGVATLLHELVDQFLREADYPAQPVFAWLLEVLDREDLSALEMLHVLERLMVLAGEKNSHHRHHRSRAENPDLAQISIGNAGPLIRAPGRMEALASLTRDPAGITAECRKRYRLLIAEAFPTTQGADCDRVGADPSDRSVLLFLAGIPDEMAVSFPKADPVPIADLATKEEPAAFAVGWEDVGMAFVISLERLFGGYRSFLPAVLLLLMGLEAMDPLMTPFSEMVFRILGVPVVLLVYGAAAARAAGRWPHSLPALVLARATTVVSYFAVMMLWVGVTAGLVTGMELHRLTPDARATGVLTTGLFSGVVVLFRLWPMVSVPFLYNMGTRFSLAAGFPVWNGSGVFRAWGMTGSAEGGWRLGFPAVLFLLVAGEMLLRYPVGGFSFLQNFFVSAVVLPWTAVFLDTAGERIRILR